MTKIALDEDQRWAPGCYLICPVTEDDGEYNWHIRDGILVQSDLDFPSTARTFGWNGNDSDIEGATDYLDAHIGDVVEEE